MKQFFYLSVLATIFLSGCTEGFKKTTDGLEYKIITSGSGKTIQYGNFMQLQIRNWYNNGKKDTVLGNSENSMPMIQMFDSVSTPLVYYNILRQLRKGDSVVIRISSDSVMKKNPMSIPPFVKKGHYFYTGLKLISIFENGAQADSAQKAAMREITVKDSIRNITQLTTDSKIIEDYLAKNKITALKAAAGTYVEIVQPGTGIKIDSSVTVKVNYTGRTFAGKTFDSNTDPAFQHVQPYNVPMYPSRPGQPGVIKGWTDGLALLTKGAKAKFYIPSSLGYGSQGNGGDIKPYDILIFDIEIVDVLTNEQAAAEAAAEQKKAELLQKRFTDSLRNAERLDSLKNKK